jgi:hypothetical protein
MRTCAIALVVASLGSLLVTPAYALRANTYVAASGTDSGSCSFSAPCRGFSYAISQVQSGGVVTALDSAGYSPFTIDRAVTIAAPPGVTPIIQGASGGTAITISTVNGVVVTLRGLTLDGLFSAQNGIAWTGTGPGGELNIIDCVVKAFNNDGIEVKPAFSAAAGSGLLISNSTIMDNFTNGIEINPQNSSTSVTYTIDHTTVSDNGVGILVNNGSAGVVAGSLSSVSVLRNYGTGVKYIGSGAAGNQYITSSYLILSGTEDFNLSGSSVGFLLGANTITQAINAGNVFSDGTNDVPFFSGTALQSMSRR